MLNNLAHVLSALGRHDEATAALEEALAIVRPALGSSHQLVAIYSINAGAVQLAARRPALYPLGARVAIGALGLLDRVTGKRGRFRRLPLAGGWTGTRDLPAPAGQTFQALWRARGGHR